MLQDCTPECSNYVWNDRNKSEDCEENFDWRFGKRKVYARFVPDISTENEELR